MSGKENESTMDLQQAWAKQLWTVTLTILLLSLWVGTAAQAQTSTTTPTLAQGRYAPGK
jgi:hypothetical protein